MGQGEAPVGRVAGAGYGRRGGPLLTLLLTLGCTTSAPVPIDPPVRVDPPLRVDPPAPVTPAPLASGLPDALHGRWGMVPADCEPGRSDAKGLLTITADALKFYEARGTPQTVVRREDHAFEGVFAYTGEGQTWTRTEILTLTGDTLTRQTDGEPGTSGPWTYTRCPGAAP